MFAEVASCYILFHKVVVKKLYKFLIPKKPKSIFNRERDISNALMLRLTRLRLVKRTFFKWREKFNLRQIFQLRKVEVKL